MPHSPLAYLSQGRLFFKGPDAAPRLIQSRFGQQVIDRSLEISQKRAWKAGNAGGGMPGALWGSQSAGSDTEVVTFTGAALGAQQLFYLLQTSALCGLFRIDPASGEEQRLFTDTGKRGSDLALHPGGAELALSLQHQNGTSNVAVVQADGSGLQTVTEGDSRDECPTWVPGEGRRLVFQSAGVARTPEGFAAGLGPASIEELDLDSGAMSTLLQAEKFDLLAPRIAEDGALLFIRRPFEGPGARRLTLGTFLLDIVLFPYRLLRALLGFLNVFSMMFTQKPLTMAGGPERKGSESGPLFLRGRRIEAEKKLRDLRSGDPDVAGLVPANWELIRRDTSGQESVLARHVLAFDLPPTGGVIYSNGRAIYALDAAGKSELVARDRVVEHVTA